MGKRSGTVFAATILLAATVLVGAAAGVAAPPPDELVIGPGAQVFVSGDNSQQFGNKQVTDVGNEDSADRDAANGLVYQLGLKARRTDQSLITQLMGPRLSLCSAGGPGAFIDFATEFGNNPLQMIHCGRAFAMDVHLEGCAADLEFHGFVHSDRSGEIFMGMMTTDVQFLKTAPNDGIIRMTVYTPKRPITVAGRVHSPTPIVMSTCG